MKTKLVFAYLAVVAMLVTGCASSPTITDGSGAPPAASSSAPSDQAKFGNTATFDSGVAVTVKAATYKAGKYATTLTGKPKNPMLFTITVKNGSTENLEAAMISTTVTSGSEESSAIVDIEKKVTGMSTATVLPGKSLTYTVAYDVKDPKDVQMDVSPDLVSHVYFVS